MGNGLADGVGDRLRREHGPLLMATGAQATWRQEKATNISCRQSGQRTREAEVQVAAAEKGARSVADHGAPETISRGIVVAVALFELRQEPLDHLIERRVRGWRGR